MLPKNTVVLEDLHVVGPLPSCDLRQVLSLSGPWNLVDNVRGQDRIPGRPPPALSRHTEAPDSMDAAKAMCPWSQPAGRGLLLTITSAAAQHLGTPGLCVSLGDPALAFLSPQETAIPCTHTPWCFGPVLEPGRLGDTGRDRVQPQRSRQPAGRMLSDFHLTSHSQPGLGM